MTFNTQAVDEWRLLSGAAILPSFVEGRPSARDDSHSKRTQVTPQ